MRKKAILKKSFVKISLIRSKLADNYKWMTEMIIKIRKTKNKYKLLQMLSRYNSRILIRRIMFSI